MKKPKDNTFDVRLELKDRALASSSEGITISDPSLPDNPLIYVNKGFERITGYSAESVLGRNCRFLQGDQTDKQAADIVRESINAEKPCTVEILNYRKDGTSFWNRLSITPVRDASGKTTHFIGIQSDITARRQVEDALKAANAKMTEDLNAAAELQKSLLPNRLPAVEHAQFAWQFKPCEQLAGDILNIVQLDEHHTAVYMVDVSGHGVSASLMAVAVSKLLSPAADASVLFLTEEPGSENRLIAPPKTVAERLNAYFQLDEESSKFMTMIYGVLDTENHTFDYICAGHPPPVLLPATGEPEILHDEQFPVGVIDQPHYTQRRIELKNGDTFMIYTDGVTDAFNTASEPFSEDRLINQLRSKPKQKPDMLLSGIIQSVEDWCGPEPIKDDISLLGFQYTR